MRNFPLRQFYDGKQRFYKYIKITQLSIFACTVQSVKIHVVNNGVASRYPYRSLAYNAVDSGLAGTECTLLEWACLAKNCAKGKM